jgi:hypothetical protein
MGMSWELAPTSLWPGAVGRPDAELLAALAESNEILAVPRPELVAVPRPGGQARHARVCHRLPVLRRASVRASRPRAA